MHPSPVTDLRTFLPTKDPELSKKFYTDLGFTINWSNEQIAELQIGFPVPAADFLGRSACRQFHDEPECRRCRRLGEHIQRQEFTKEYPGIMGKAPEMEPWGIRVLYLSDPTGAPWHHPEMRKSGLFSEVAALYLCHINWQSVIGTCWLQIFLSWWRGDRAIV